MRIIDFRGRPATPEFAAYGDTRVYSPRLAQKNYRIKVETLEDMAARMDRLEIVRSVVTGRDIETTFGYRIPNEVVSDIVRRYPGRFVGFAGIDPNKGIMNGVVELERCYQKLGLRGLSLDPYMHKHPLNDKIYYPLYAKCAELRIPVVFTTGAANRMPETLVQHGAPSLIDEVATDFPQLNLVASHGCYPYVLETIALMGRHRNVYVELSGVDAEIGVDLFARAANEGSITDRLMFASAFPLRPLEVAIANYMKLGFSDDVLPKVMYDNAAQLLGV